MLRAPVRLGIVGLGAVAQLVYEPILSRRRDLFHIAGVAELSATVRDTVGERLCVPPAHRHDSVAELLDAGEVEALLVLSSGSHGAVVDTVTAEGIPALVEKPLAWTHEELDRLAGRERLIQVGYMKRFDPAYQRLAGLLAEAAAPIRAVEVTVLHPSDARQIAFRGGELARATDLSSATSSDLEARSSALREKALGDAAGTLGWVYSEVLLGSLIHDLAVLRPLVGDPLRISWARLWPDHWGPDRLSVGCDADLADDVQLSIRWHYLPDYPRYRETVRIHTEEGSYTLVFPSPYVLHAPTELTVTTAAGEYPEARRSLSHVEAFEAQLESFHAVVTGGRAPTIGIDEARADITTCQRIASDLASNLMLPLGGEAGNAA